MALKKVQMENSKYGSGQCFELIFFCSLNTNTKLYASLKEVVASGDKFAEDDVDKRVAQLFLFDFEQSGIHLEEDKVSKIILSHRDC